MIKHPLLQNHDSNLRVINDFFCLFVCFLVFGTAKDDTSEEDTSSKASQSPAPSSEFKTPNETASSSSTSGTTKRRGKSAAVAYMPPKQLKTEPGTDEKSVEKFLKNVNDGELSEFDVWTNPPDFSFEDDFIVPENSDLNKVSCKMYIGYFSENCFDVE